MDLSPVIAASGSVGLFGVICALLWRLLVLQNRREDDRDDDITYMKAENAWCNKRVSLLIYACQQGGIAIPQEVWDGPPAVIVAPRRGRSGVRRGHSGRSDSGSDLDA